MQCVMLSVQIVCGRVVEQQLSEEEKPDRKTEPGHIKTATYDNHGGAYTLWVASVPQPAVEDGQSDVNITEEVPDDSKLPEGDRP